jgi:ABC-type nitrate/sulfonate/bicarbonate transport system substrate-binding protein
MKDDGVVDPINQIEMLSSPEETLVDSLHKGDFDVVALHLLPENILKLYKDVEILATDYDIFEDRGGDVGYFVTKKFLAENPDTVKAFIRAISKTNNYINANQKEVYDYFIESNDYTLNKELFYVQHFAEDALITPSHIETWLELLSAGDGRVALDELEFTGKKLTFDQVATNEYNPAYKG